MISSHSSREIISTYQVRVKTTVLVNLSLMVTEEDANKGDKEEQGRNPLKGTEFMEEFMH